ncbi:phosphomannomutase/phosphoglucomutase [Microlunatus parietis]|uniref:Phosphomannomutase n=1 Tax=Microlunatus parietis TaxID=682979 RepID=A0A7Y9I658_9ACTN|nr:phosphomannomutase/phosphoglucomutase [Microlunatus parietis]NYE70750.1 phosphomannomutase [Microlunatus parietis]
MITPGIFKANDIRGRAVAPDPDWDADGARAIGAAWVEVTGLRPGLDQLVIGRDMRLTSPEFAAAFADGVASRGVDVIDIGLASTDQLWYACGALGLPGAMFTASHNPAPDNGIKFCRAGALPVASADLVALADRVLTGPPAEPAAQPVARRGTITERDLLADYAAYLHSLVDLTGLRRLRVVADAGNGMAGHTLPAVLGSLDLDLIGLYTDPDGTFPNHPPNPLEPQNLVDAQAAVREHGADLGLVFDGDADRCFLIDETGAVVSPSVITAMIAGQELDREPGATIVCNTITSRAVPELVQRRGGKVVITRVGHTFVKAAMAEHGAIFGGEHSAHYYFRDFWGADTGMLAALHVLALVGRTDAPLSKLVEEFCSYVESGEINSTVADQKSIMDRLAAAFGDRGELSTLDGLTVSGPGWWFNVRPSNTEPLLRLNVEAADPATMAALRDEALALIRRP